MKANRISRDRQDAAEVGIGTLIVFIATILVAAVASAVLIDTSNSLQQKAQSTGQQATQQVATNLDVVQVVGQILATGTSGKINALNVTVGLAPGAKQLDLSQLVIRLSDGSSEKRLVYAQTDAANKYTATSIRDADSSFSAGSPVMTAGDLVLLNVNLTGNSLDLNTRTSVAMDLIPEIGAPVSADFVTPATFGTDKVFQLR
jgi:flagellin FlaB